MASRCSAGHYGANFGRSIGPFTSCSVVFVNADMLGQVIRSRETLATFRKGTLKWLLAGMCATMSLEMLASFKNFTAVWVEARK